jgi:hypothetical protein
MKKHGISTYPMEVMSDSKMQLIEAEYGIFGFSVIVKLFQQIYGGEGYYALFTEDEALMFCKENGIGVDMLSDIVSSALEKGIFDSAMFWKHRVLTSRKIQQVYLKAAGRRKRIELNGDYLLVSFSALPQNAVVSGVCNSEENADISEENADILFKHVYRTRENAGNSLKDVCNSEENVNIFVKNADISDGSEKEKKKKEKNQKKKEKEKDINNITTNAREGKNEDEDYGAVIHLMEQAKGAPLNSIEFEGLSALTAEFGGTAVCESIRKAALRGAVPSVRYIEVCLRNLKPKAGLSDKRGSPRRFGSSSSHDRIMTNETDYNEIYCLT